MSTPMDKEIPLVQGAASVRRSYNVLLRRVLLGEIEGRQDDRGRWLVSRASLDIWARANANPPRAVAA